MVLGPENGIWAPLSEPPLFPKRIMITSIRQQGGSTTAQFTTIVSRLLVKNEFFYTNRIVISVSIGHCNYYQH